MLQYQAIETITEAILRDHVALAIYLKGSIARKEEDEFSDVDFYVVVKEQDLPLFLNKRLEYLSSYAPILYHSNAGFGVPQIVCVFDNGLHFDFYTTTIKQINQYDEIVILYDPNSLLIDYQKKELNLSSEETANVIHSFCFAAIEFHAAYQRKDFLFAFRLANHMLTDLGTYLRSIIEPEKAKIGIKRFTKMLIEPYKNQYIEISKKLTYDSVLLSVKLMYSFLDKLVMQIPLHVAEQFNFEFFQFTKKLIMGME